MKIFFHYYYHISTIFRPAVTGDFHWSDDKSFQLLRTLPDIRFSLHLFFSSNLKFSQFLLPYFSVVPSVPFLIGINVIFMFDNFSSSSMKTRYFSGLFVFCRVVLLR